MAPPYASPGMNTAAQYTTREHNGGDQSTKACYDSERMHARQLIQLHPCLSLMHRAIPTRTQPKWHCLGHTGIDRYLHPDEAHIQTHRSTGRIQQPDRKQRKPHTHTATHQCHQCSKAPLPYAARFAATRHMMPAAHSKSL